MQSPVLQNQEPTKSEREKNRSNSKLGAFHVEEQPNVAM